MVDKILVHLDPSRPQRKARELAADMAERLDAELLALYVVDEKALMAGAEPIKAVQDALTAIGEQSLSDYREEVPRETQFEKLIGYGDTAKTIAHYVRREGADLVVTGGFHMSAYERIPFGSVVSDIIHRVQTSVLLIRDYHPVPDDGRPVIQAYGGDKGSVKALYASAPIAKSFGSKVVATHVASRRRASEAETLLMSALAHRENLGVELDIDLLEKRTGQASWRSFVREAKARDANFLVVGREYMAPGFLGPVSPIDKLVVHTKTPLLAMWDG